MDELVRVRHVPCLCALQGLVADIGNSGSDSCSEMAFDGEQRRNCFTEFVPRVLRRRVAERRKTCLLVRVWRMMSTPALFLAFAISWAVVQDSRIITQA